ncbi:MAG: hypothetical protein ACP5QG_03260 [candidate division WOR-3 bacterium]
MAEVEDELTERIAKRVVDMGMGMISIAFLESLKPISFIGSSILVFARPIFSVFFDGTAYDRFVELVEDRRNIEHLVDRIEQLQDEKG